jgi:nicotinamidase-related amidase
MGNPSHSQHQEQQQLPIQAQGSEPVVSSYDELKIRDGPIYSVNAPERNESNECLLEYEAQQRKAAGMEDTESRQTGNIRATASSTSPTTSTSQLEEYFAPHKPAPLKAETTALLIVDVQPEYWSNCPAVRKDFSEFPQRLARTIDICRSRRAKIIWVRADYRYSHSPWLMQFERIRGPRNLGEVPCDPSSQDFSWEDFATPQGGEVIIAKSSWSSTSNTALMDILRVAGIETVLVCGLITSVCVQHSAFGIFEAGYRTLLVTDACADRGRARHEAALALYGDYMYELISSDDLEDEQDGLIPAKPVWLMLDSKTKTVRANSFPMQVDAASANVGTAPVTPPEPVVIQATDPVPQSTVSTTTKSSSPEVVMSSSSTVSTASSSSNGDEDDDDASTMLSPKSSNSVVRVTQ